MSDSSASEPSPGGLGFQSWVTLTQRHSINKVQLTVAPPPALLSSSPAAPTRTRPHPAPRASSAKNSPHMCQGLKQVSDPEASLPDTCYLRRGGGQYADFAPHGLSVCPNEVATVTNKMKVYPDKQGRHPGTGTENAGGRGE